MGGRGLLGLPKLLELRSACGLVATGAGASSWPPAQTPVLTFHNNQLKPEAILAVATPAEQRLRGSDAC